MTSSRLPDGDDSALANKVRALRDARCYSHMCDRVDTIETHFACIFLAGEFAYKLKKPLRVERMDFRRLTERQRVCFEEVQLNRRLAPNVYLDVVPLTRDANQQWRVGGDGEVVDWLVKMRRLPAHLMLDRAIIDGTVQTSDVQRAAKLLSLFYRQQPAEEITGEQYRVRFVDQIENNRRDLLAEDLNLPRETVQSVIDGQMAAANSMWEMLERRGDERRVVEAHGDLRPEHVYLGEPPCIIDCLEFDRDLRVFDPVEELSFLLLECERLHAPWVAEEFFAVYRETTKDTPSPALIDLYFAHRAVTRAKITAWHLRDEAVRHITDWRALTCDYLQRARDRL